VLQKHCRPSELLMGITFLKKHKCMTDTTASEVGKNCCKMSLAVRDLNLL